MTTSEQINELAAALAKAQTTMGHALKDSTNPHFRSQYADLQSVRDAAKPLADNGIAIAQSCRMSVWEGQMVAEVETRLIHTSGQWISDTLAVPVSKPDAQGIGSAITYGRRYTLAAFAGIAPADDDGEAAVGRVASQPVAEPVSDGPLKVTGVTNRETSGGRIQWTVAFSDGVKATTIAERTGLLAESLHISGAPVTRKLEKKGSFTNLVSLASEKPAMAPVEPITAPDVNDIPF